MKTIVLLNILISFLVQQKGFSSVFNSGVDVLATYPISRIDSNIYYRVYESNNRARVQPIKTCVLIHGHGIKSDIISFIQKYGDLAPFKQIGTVLGIGDGAPRRIGGNREGSGAARRALGQFLSIAVSSELPKKLAALKELDGTTAFANYYWGKYFREELLQSSCERVVVTVQESVQTSILEMIVSTEGS